jgi:hypothetical protein
VFQPSPLDAEVYRPPSAEARRLVRRVAWLTSPARGEAPVGTRLALQLLIAPMTQLTFFSFELQAFLFLVFHRHRVAIVGHALFMTTVNLFLLATLREVAVAHTAAGTLDAGLLYAALLLVWYGGVALQARLPGWFAASVPIVAGLYTLAGPLGGLCRARLHLSPAWGIVASAMLVALSHSAEPHLPPRTVDPWRWVPLREYLVAPGGAWARLVRLAYLGVVFVIGSAAEAWASLRLMHYNWLMLMMRLGYAPARRAELEGWAERAWATGQPALDFVGSGGGTFLAPALSSRRSSP